MTTKPPVADNDNHHDFYVYAWLRPNGEPFYIGKGRGNRDVKPKRNRIFQNIVKKIEAAGGETSVVRVASDLSEVDALELEKDLIRLYGRKDKRTGTLSNLTDGGDGASGYVPTEEVRQRISRALTGRKRPPEVGNKISLALRGRPVSDAMRELLRTAATGRIHTEEAKRKIGDAARGNQYCLGKTLSEETRGKISSALMGHPVSAETATKISVALKGNKNCLGRTMTEAQRLHLSIVNTGKTHSEETRRKLSLKMTGRKHTEGAKKKRALANQKAPPRVGFKGVFPLHKKWMARIKIDKKPLYLGSFSTQEDAARAYDAKAAELWGNDCYLNFPDDVGGDATNN